MRRLSLALVAALVAATPLSAASADPAIAARVERVLKSTPLVDGHNDWPWALRENLGAKLWRTDLARLPAPFQTDLDRLRQGRVGGQFWSVWVPFDRPPDEQVRLTLEQIDTVRQLVARHPDRLELATTAADIRRIHRAGKVASLIGAEGGDQIGGSLAVLRQFHALGLRYLTLTHVRTIDWADAATDEPKHGGLTPFGVKVVREMNRLGMLVDLSHVSPDTMRDAVAASRAPVIFSHSGARALVDHPRNVPDDVLRLVAVNGGVVMVNFAPAYGTTARVRWAADRAAEGRRLSNPPYGGLLIGQPDRIKAAMAAWDAANPQPPVTLGDIADHIDHVAKVAGHDHVGLGGDFDGIPAGPVGLEGVDTYPALLAELMRRGWTDAQVAALAGGNLLRVMEAAERVARSLSGEPPAD